jgi:probable HAF family extracellular repeat protein
MAVSTQWRRLMMTAAMFPVLMFLSGQASAEDNFVDVGNLGAESPYTMIGTYSRYIEGMSGGISGNGAVAFGRSNTPNGQGAFRWTDGAITDVGTLGGNYSFASAVSYDGSVVVGQSNTQNNSQTRAFRWENGIMVDLGTLVPENQNGYSYAINVSGDGSTVVGVSTVDSNQYYSHAFRWNAGVMSDLGTLGGYYSTALAASYNGSVVVGESQTSNQQSSHAFRWAAGEMVDLGTLGGNYSYSSAGFVSANGAVVAGQSYNLDNQFHGFRWVDGEMTDIGTLGGTYSYLLDMSSDGTTLVGGAGLTDNSSTHAFRWQNGVMEDLGVLEGSTGSFANAVSADGSVVVGSSSPYGGFDTYSQNAIAFRWTERTGMESVADWVASEGGSVPLGYALTSATGVSAAGNVVVGSGYYGGRQVGWLARGNGFLSDTAAFDQSLIDTSGAAATAALGVTILAVSGSHHRTLLDTPLAVSANGIFAWSTADAARNNETDAHSTLAEVGLGADVGGFRVGAAFGTTDTKQNWDLGGNAKVNGKYFLAEIDHDFAMAGESVLRGSLLGFYGDFDATLNRAYLNGAATDISSGAPSVKSRAIKAKLDWINAAKLGSYSVSPFAALTVSQAKVAAYTETGGGFPASFAEQKTDSSEIRIGAALSRKVSDTTNVRFGVEGVHEFNDTTGGINGEVTGLYAFGLAGQKLNRNWARATVDVDYNLSDKTLLTGGFNVATRSNDPSFGVTIGLKSSF